jgi:hypothetical protein
MKLKLSCLLCCIALEAACTSASSNPAPSGALSIKRPAGHHDYVFTSTQRTPGGATRVEVAFTLETSTEGMEEALITAYRHGPASGPLQAGQIDAPCTQRLAAPIGVIAVLRSHPRHINWPT